MHRPRLIGCAACLVLGLVDLVYLDAFALPPLLRGDGDAQNAAASPAAPDSERAVAPPTAAAHVGGNGSSPTNAPVLALRDKAPPPSPPGAALLPRPRAEPSAKANPLAIVTFETTSAHLSHRFAPAMGQAARRIGRVAEAVHIEGHADARGENEFNQELSERRARAVADWLHRLGIPPERMTIHGFGSRRPVAIGSDPETYARNRRVEIWLGRRPVMEEAR